MYRYNDQKEYPKRKSPRAKNYNYRTPGHYFVTICTKNHKCLFWDGLKQNQMGQIAYDAVAKIDTHASGVKAEKFVVMPNHIHMIIVLENDRQDLSVVIGQYKAYVSKRIHEILPGEEVWQVSFHDHKIRNQKQYEKIWTYIENNPKKWEMDCFYMELG
jgi:REP element-mobilizing transposase RayT